MQRDRLFVFEKVGRAGKSNRSGWILKATSDNDGRVERASVTAAKT